MLGFRGRGAGILVCGGRGAEGPRGCGAEGGGQQASKEGRKDKKCVKEGQRRGRMMQLMQLMMWEGTLARESCACVHATGRGEERRMCVSCG